ncbi:MAG: ABC transporter permease [Dehalococcoidia bacterium]|nr:MAG: ABC transporter permease [Dehalococcoidia bacterium]
MATFQESRRQYSEWRRIAQVYLRRKVSVLGLVIIVGLIVTAIFAPLLAPYDPTVTDVVNKLQQPSSAHWFGTDQVGRDVLSRVIYGARTSLLIALGAMGLAAVIGQTLGLIAGYFGGWRFHIIMRIMDALMAIPRIVLAIMVSAVLGGGVRNLILALGIAMVAGQARMMCGQVLTVKQNDYILAGRTIGVNHLRMMLRHIYPNAFQPLLVMVTVGLGMTIMSEAALSFLGLGISAQTAAWGSMISDGQNYLFSNPVLSIAPGVAIGLVVFGFNMAGDGLRDALDPRLRGVV